MRQYPEQSSGGWEKCFREAISESEIMHEYLCRIARAYARKGALPSSVLLGTGFSSLPSDLLNLFGSEALHLSKSGEVRLRLSQFMNTFDNNTQLTWVTGLFAALGLRLPWSREKRCDRQVVFTALERFRLANRDMENLYALLAAELENAPARCRRLAALGDRELFQHFSTIGETVRFLISNRETITSSDLGARFFGDSKLLRSKELRAIVADGLIVSDKDFLPVDCLRKLCAQRRNELRERALKEHCVSDNPGASKVTIFGPLIYHKNGTKFDYPYKLWQTGEPVTLSLDNLTGIETLRIEGPCRVYGCENESPFYRLIRERQPGMVVYTQGFPNSAVREFWRLVSRNVTGCSFFHWGDTDLAGLRIAAILHHIAALKLWRCSLDVIQKHREKLIPLEPGEKTRAERLLAYDSDFPFIRELEVAINWGWLEQENYTENLH